MSPTRQVLAVSAALLVAGAVSVLPAPARPPPRQHAPSASSSPPSGPGRVLSSSAPTAADRMGGRSLQHAAGHAPAAGPSPPAGVPAGSARHTVPAQARVAPAAAAESSPRWRWPVEPHVVRRFDAPTSPWGPGHRGLDLAARDGLVVRAVEAGTVTHAGVLAGRGTVTVRHGDGLRSTYEPLSVRVSVGDTVQAGDILGTVEATGGHCGSMACLHLGAVGGAGYLDPWPLLVGGHVRLLPLGAP